MRQTQERTISTDGQTQSETQERTSSADMTKLIKNEKENQLTPLMFGESIKEREKESNSMRVWM